MAYDMGKTIRQRRELLGMSEEGLAKKLGYKGKSSINKIELGIAKVPQKKISAFAEALEMTPQELCGWTEERAQVGFRYCLEQQMRILGYSVIYDEEGNVILDGPNGQTEVTLNDIKELEERMALFLKVTLMALSKENADILED